MTLALRRLDLDKCIILALCGISLLTNLPVLLQPHWGLFNDIRASACQTFCSMSPPDMMRETSSVFTHLDHGRYRPIYQLINPILWSIHPNDPLVFYLVRFCEFTATVVMCYLAALTLSASRTLSVMVALAWFVSLPTYEVIYTPDKTEVHVAFLFSVVLLSYLKWSARSSHDRLPVFQLAMPAALIGLASLLSCMIKETGLLLAAFGVLSATICAITRKKGWALKHEIGTSVDLRWQLLSASALILSAAIFKRLEKIAVPSTDQYVALALRPAFTVQHLWEYAQLLPVYASMILLCVLTLFYRIYSRRRSGNFTLSFEELASAQLMATSLAGCIALAAWPVTLAYIWYPLLPLLLPAFAGILKSTNRRHEVYVVGIVTGALLVFSLPQTIVNARFQLTMDAGLDRMATRLAALPMIADNQVSVGLPFMSAQSQEIGSAVSEHTRSKMRGKNQIPNFFNFLYNVDREKQAPSDLETVVHYNELRNAPAYNAEPGLATFSLTPGTGLSIEINWLRSKLKAGDLLVIPFGTLSPKTTVYRGSSIFTRPWQETLRAIPQVDVSPNMVLDQSSTGKLAGNNQLGWMLVSVKKVVPVALEVETDGWLLDGAKITLKRETAPQLLTLWFDMPAHDVTYTDGTTSHTAKPEKVTTRLSTIKIPIPSSDKATEIALQFSSAAPEKLARDDRPVLLHLTKVSLDQL